MSERKCRQKEIIAPKGDALFPNFIVQGGFTNASVGPLWELKLQIPHASGEERRHAMDAVKHSPAVRVLSQRTHGDRSLLPIKYVVSDLPGHEPHYECSKWVQPKSEIPLQFRSPVLIAINPELRKDGGSRCSVFLNVDHTIRASVVAPSPIPLHSIIATPLEIWPDQRAQPAGPTYYRQPIAFPVVRLVEGKIRLQIARTSGRDIYSWLGFQAGRIFENLKFIGPGDGVLELAFTPEGIEFDVEIPDPSYPLDNSSGRNELQATVRLEAHGKDFILRLVALNRETGDLAAVNRRLGSAFAELRRFRSPLRVDYDARSEEPAIWWPLRLQPGSGRALDSLCFGERSGGEWKSWQAGFDPKTFRMRLLTDPAEKDGIPSSALLRQGAVTLTYESGQVQLGYGFGTVRAPDSANISVWYLRREVDSRPADYYFYDAEISGSPATLPTAEHAERLGQRYAARNLIVAGRPTPYLFLAVVDGVLQIRAPGADDGKPLQLEGPERRALEGGAAFGLGELLLRIDSAGGVRVLVHWNNGTADAISVDIGDFSGEINDLVWLAEESPSVMEVVPTGDGSPAATRGMGLYFGLPATLANAEFNLSVDEASSGKAAGLSGSWTLHLESGNGMADQAGDTTPPEVSPGDSPAAIYWRRHARLPLIASMSMTRTVASSGLPSATRGFMPTCGDSGITLSGQIDGGIPAVTAYTQKACDVVKWPWPEVYRETVEGDCDSGDVGPNAVAMVSPTLPGVEYAPAPVADDLEAHDEGEAKDQLRMALRFDLPVLDELFAGARPADQAEQDTEDGEAGDQRVVTALTPGRLASEWWRRQALAHAGTGAVDVRATIWFDQNGATEVRHLQAPYCWRTEVIVSETPDRDENETFKRFPIGAIAFTDGDSFQYGDSALAGIGTGEKAARFVIRTGALEREDSAEDGPGVLSVIGFAPSLFQETADGGYFDTRGLAWGDQGPSSTWHFGGSVMRTRSAERSLRGGGGTFFLASLDQTVSVRMPGAASDCLFWFRDVALGESKPASGAARLLFDIGTSPQESSLGPRSSFLDEPDSTGQLSPAIHEWRFFDPVASGKWHLPFGVLGFKPLRLLQLVVGGDGASFSILGSLQVPALGNEAESGTSVFEDDFPYGTSALARLQFRADTDGGFKLHEIAQVRLKKGALDVELEPDDGTYRVLVDAKVRTNGIGAGEEAGRPFELKIEIINNVENPVGEAVLKGRLFGRVWTLTGGSVTRNDEGDGSGQSLVVTFPELVADSASVEGQTPSQGLRIGAAKLVLDKAKSDRLTGYLDISFDVDLPVTFSSPGANGEFQPRPSLMKLGPDGVRWLGVHLPIESEALSIVVDHDRGVVRIDISKQGGGGAELDGSHELFCGVSFTKPHLWLSATIAVDGTKPNGGPDSRKQALLPDGTLFSAWIEQRAKDPLTSEDRVATRVRCSMFREPGEKPISAARLSLDRLQVDWMESGVKWPLDADIAAEPAVRDEKTGDGTFNLLYTGPSSVSQPAALHRVRPVILGAGLDLTDLVVVGDRIRLRDVWNLTLRVDHQLSLGNEQLRWSTVDQVSLFDPERLRQIARDNLRSLKCVGGDESKLSYAFAALYRSDRYRGEDFERSGNPIECKNPGVQQSCWMRHTGIARPVLAASGFHDAVLNKYVAEGPWSVPDGTLVATGSSWTFYPSGEGTIVFSVPWLATLVIGGGAEPGSVVSIAPPFPLQTFTEGRKWKVAQADAVPLVLAGRKRVAGCSLASWPTESEVRTLLIRGCDPDAADAEANGPTAFDVERVEQVYLEPDTSDGAVGDISVEQWPFFLRSLLGLRAVWKVVSEGSSLQELPAGFISVHYVPDKGPESTRAATYVAAGRYEFGVPRDPKPDTVDPALLGSAIRRRLALVDEMGVLRWSDLARLVDMAGSKSATANARQLRELAQQRSPRVRAIAVVHQDAAGHAREIESVPLMDAIEQLGAMSKPLRCRNQAVHPSPALGWPADPNGDGNGLLDIGRLATNPGGDHPVSSNEAGFAGRSAEFAFKPLAYGKGETESYLRSSSRVMFRRVADPDKVPASSRTISPDAGFGYALSPRARVPLAGAVTEALRTVSAPAPANFAFIQPAQVVRSYVGQRPGVIDLTLDGIIRPQGVPKQRPEAIDPGWSAFGAPGTAASPVLRQVRAPRSPALPDEPKLELRRRTYVSNADRTGGRLKAFTLLPGTATVLRLSEELENADYRFLLRLGGFDSGDPSGSFCSTGTLDLAFLARPELRLHVELCKAKRPKGGIEDISANELMGKLAKSGVLNVISNDPKTLSATLVAQLVVGDLSVPFQHVSWTAPEADKPTATIELTLEMLTPKRARPDGFEQLRTLVQQADPDLQPRLELRLIQDGSNAAAAEPGQAYLAQLQGEEGLSVGPPITLSMPLMLRPSGRLTREIDVRTLIFGDPAYDRGLGSAAKQRLVPVEIGQDAYEYLLATDRHEYGLADTVYFAVGWVDRERGRFVEQPPTGKFTLAIKRPRPTRAGEVPVNEPLRVEAIGVEFEAGLRYSYEVKHGTAYALPLSALRSLDSLGNVSGPAELKPGERLSLELTLQQGTTLLRRTLQLGITKDSQFAPPASVYSLVDVSIGGKEGDASRPTSAVTSLHASAPTPQLVEFVDLDADLVRGYVRRKALFVWRHTGFATQRPPDVTRYSTLVKIDRSGGGQLPNKLADFVKAS